MEFSEVIVLMFWWLCVWFYSIRVGGVLVEIMFSVLVSRVLFMLVVFDRLVYLILMFIFFCLLYFLISFWFCIMLRIR